MREFTFSINHEAGTDSMMDVFIDHPYAVSGGWGGPGFFGRIQHGAIPDPSGADRSVQVKVV